MKRITLLAVLLCVVLFVGCGNSPFEGDTGPQGPPGADGLSAMILVGPDVPTPDLGNVGDVYIAAGTGDIYGPKTLEGWGEPSGNIQGPPGADGADGLPGITGPPGPKGDQGAVGASGELGKDGNWIWQGHGYPPAEIGLPGDYFIDTRCWNFYGPKTIEGWGDPVGSIRNH